LKIICNISCSIHRIFRRKKGPGIVKKTINKKNLVGDGNKNSKKGKDSEPEEKDISDDETSRYSSFKSKNEKQKN
jgi:hypothetical protein